MTITADEIVDKLITSIEEKNYFYGERMEMINKQHAIRVSELQNEITECERTIVRLSTENGKLRE